MTYLLALDQGTTSCRAILFDARGRVVRTAQQPLTQHFPRPGWVEHDAMEIRDRQFAVAREAMGGVEPGQIAGLGITNQRETTVVWDRATGEPIHRAIVWQDRRTAEMCARLRDEGLGPHVRRVTGLRLDPYFSGTKLAWLLENVAGARERAERGDLLFGTVDAWLVWWMTGGPDGGRHLTDVTNASRTLLWDLRQKRWDPLMLDALGIPEAMLPDVTPCAAAVGTWNDIAITGIAGDQHAALFGQGCLSSGDAKYTLGTGGFLLLNTGETAVASDAGLLTTTAWDLGHGLQYALEGSVFVAGAAVQWLGEGLGLLDDSREVGPLAASVESAGGVVFVPAFTGLGAPTWDPDARGSLFGLTRGTTVAHIARATLEGIAHQTADVLESMQSDSGLLLDRLRVDGGAASNDVLLQIHADLLGVSIERPANVEATAWGAAALAGIGAGVLSPESIVPPAPEAVFTPTLSDDERQRQRGLWRQAVERTRGWAAL
ncbi:glycerol kinase GlpK [Rubricoccus marinus]|uniref:ATP:glycerol 3-phosphotransferase n=1 Tax=Rubricoccus marinus TaxID=716817 RepID=A0A259TY99_9BACT|nr:glycerol kinase GlpK [Rubricoccus marinus]OZC02755.1 glycerol kinase [Rubricoccus marinus]